MSYSDRYIEERIASEAENPTSLEQYPEVCVSLFIRRDNELLLGNKRIGNQTFEYSGLGGAFEHMQALGALALPDLITREVGPDLRVKNLGFASISNVVDFPPRHFVINNFITDWESGEATSPATSSCQSWEWHPINDLPEQLGLEARHMAETLQTGRAVFDGRKEI